MIELLDNLLWLLPLLGVSFGTQSSQGQSGGQKAEQTGLSAGQSPILSTYVGPGLQGLYNYSTDQLGLGQTVQAGGPVLGYSGGYPTGATYMPGQALGPKSGNYALPGGNYWNATSGLIRSGSPEGWRQEPSTKQPFALPALDANGFYGGQTSALDALLERAYSNLGTTGAGGASVLEASLPQLLGLIGSQTVGGAVIPEQVRQQQTQDVNAVLSLISGALGGTSTGSAFNTFSNSGLNAGILSSGAGGAAVSGFAGAAGAAAGAAAFCWIALELYGPDSPKVMLIRWWLLTAWPTWVVNLYRRYGQAIVRLMRRSRLVKGTMRLIFDGLVRGARKAYG